MVIVSCLGWNDCYGDRVGTNGTASRYPTSRSGIYGYDD